jgi:hypothetical protein
MDGFFFKLTFFKFLIEFLKIHKCKVKFPINMSINLSIGDKVHLNLNEVQTNVGKFSFYLENHWFQFLKEIRRTNLIFEQFLFNKNLYMF